VPRTVEIFFEIAEKVGLQTGSDEQKAATLRHVYRERAKLTSGEA
jgi:hypothetical protein